MKKALPLLLLLLFIPLASADDGHDEYTVNNAPGGLGGASIVNTVIVAYTPWLPTQTTTTVGVTVAASAMQAGVMALTLLGSSLTGCSVGAMTTTAGTTNGDSERIPVTLTGEDCSGTIDIQVAQGATTIGHINAKIAIIDNDLRVHDDANGWNINTTTSAGFWELFGPLLLVFAFAMVLTRPKTPIWVTPAALVAGLGVMLMAFTQPLAFLVLLQALAGAFLAVFSIAMMAVRRLEFKPGRPKKGFFDD